MADFKTIMRDAQRMCKHKKSCDACNLYGICPFKFYSNAGTECIEFDFEKIESFVEMWAESNKIMPNADMFKEVFGVDVNPGTPHDCAGISCPHERNCNTCEYRNFWSKEYKRNEDEI